ncbi:protein kinase [Actinoplanes sp. TBRC 11911]|uniref:serine/threonine-protein kinase n=1 Tax=Actinoplanes sp. TBRC 11911 TaxID=2729386 RepID=UPI00145E2DA6|nr:serine/threonine-protein kinase [Actinoplanes sp. TBRC 11911]NMO50661.1 protein kinase [Actinoplanes sp. TBRC 11911]
MEVRQVLGGRYKLLNELGSGGMAVVWRARDEVLGRHVAVKVLAARYAGDPQSRERIRDEARAAANLSHPNIAQVYDYGEAAEGGSPLPFVVMELIDGLTLQQRVASGPLPPRKVFRICGEVAAALAVAHAEDLVHRDIKMANIMVTPGGAKVVDFGIAAAVGPAPEDMLVGTPAYLAPERLTGDAVVPASDVYALGVLLYRLLAGEAPWSVETTTQMLQAHVYVNPAPLPELAGVPSAVSKLVGRCLRKDPAERPTASEVSSTLADAAEASVSPAGASRGTSGGFAAAGEPRGAQNRIATDLAAAKPSPVVPRPARNTANRGAQTLVLPPGGAGAAARQGAARQGAARQGAAGKAAAGQAAARSDAPGVLLLPPGVLRPSGRGARRVPLSKRKSLLAGGGVVAVTVAALLLWFVPGGDGENEKRSPAGGSTASVAPVRGLGVAPTVSDGAAAPATAVPPGRPPHSGGNPAASAAPAGTARPSAGAPAGTSGPSDAPEISPTASPTPGAGGKRLSSPGGSVLATCADGKATLTDWQPAAGYEVERVDPGPALTALIIFKGPTQRYRMRVSCVAGEPTPFVLPL